MKPTTNNSSAALCGPPRLMILLVSMLAFAGCRRAVTPVASQTDLESAVEQRVQIEGLFDSRWKGGLWVHLADDSIIEIGSVIDKGNGVPIAMENRDVSMTGLLRAYERQPTDMAAFGRSPDREEWSPNYMKQERIYFDDFTEYVLTDVEWEFLD